MNECELYQELISRLVDGELSRNEYAALDAHMENCAECSAMYAVFASLSDVIGSEDEPLPEDLHENIMAGVRRSAMINRNKRRLSKPLRNSLAAAACAALVFFAAKGLSPAQKAESTMLSRTEADVMDVQSEEAAAQSPAEAAVESPTAQPAAAVTPSPAAGATVKPTATPVPTADIYLGGDEEEADYSSGNTNTPNNNSVVVTTPPAAIVVDTPVATNTPAPVPVTVPSPTAAAEPAVVSEEPVQESAPAPAAESAAPQAEAAPAAMDANAAEPQQPAGSGEAAETDAAPAAAEPEPAATEAPTLQNRLFSFFGLTRPNAEIAGDASADITSAGPLATETPAEETQPAESPAVEEAEEEMPAEPVVKLGSLEKLTALEELLDGMEEALPEGEADEVYVFCLAKPDEMFPDYKIKVFIFGEKLYFEQFFCEDDSIVCLSGCTVEDFAKFMETLTDEEKAELLAQPSPSPGAAPVESAPPAAESPAAEPMESPDQCAGVPLA